MSPAGHDDAPGTAARPWATIRRAARALQAGDTAVIRGGVYRESIQIAVASGTARAPITYQAAAGERVVIDAAGHAHGIRIGESDIVIDGLEVINASGFGIAVHGRSGVLIRRCVLHHNGRSGIGVARFGAVRIDRCLIHRNGRDGVEVFGRSGELAVTASTIWGNGGDGIDSFVSDVRVAQSIIAENGEWGVTARAGARITVAYSDIWGNAGGAFAPQADLELGQSVLQTDPFLHDPAGGDLRLASNSPAVGSSADGGDMGYPFSSHAPARNRPPNRAPLVDAGPTLMVRPPANDAHLDGTAIDDGLPHPPGRLDVRWSQTAGPAAVAFDDSGAVDTRAVFAVPGTYVLRLTADDGKIAADDEVTIEVVAHATSDGFVAGALDGWDLDAADILLQTIYGTRQDTRGNITANTPVALSIDKGLGIAFAVRRETALDTLRLKLQNAKPEVGIRLRLYDVTHRGFLDDGAAPSRSAPGGPDNVAIFDRTYFTPAVVAYHLEPLASPTARYSDLIVDFGPLEVLSGEYFLAVDNVGPSNTIGSLVVGDSSEAPAMGERPDGRPLPGGVRIGTGQSVDNLRYYKLASTEDAAYTAEPRCPAMQLTTTVVNHPPVVDAGEDQLITLPTAVARLDGVVDDDGHPAPPGAVTSLWTRVSGPGAVQFDDATAPRTTAAFSAFGVHVLRLTVTDSERVASDEVTIKWLEQLPPNEKPRVDAGPDQQISLPRSALLRGVVTDDGEPDPPGIVATTWSLVSGPGTVDFDDPHDLRTSATFSVEGTYVLRLTADDGQESVADELTVVVHPFGRYEGYGAGATGGAGGEVVTVTNLDDSGPGSFRDAVDRLDGTPTIIQFAVGGGIFVSGEIRIARDNVTVMGSSAPAPGITLNGESADRVLGIKASNVIVENLRIRNAALENVVLWGGRDIVIDHCSITWSGDGALDINGGGYDTGVNHVTISRSLFAGAVEVSRSHGHRISWHYNLFTHNNRRQPKIALAGPDYNFICNYVRAWGNTAINIQDSAHVNIVNNFFGPPYPTESWEQACYTSGSTRAIDVHTAGNAHAGSEPGGDGRRLYDVNKVGAADAPFAIEPPPVPVTIVPGAEVPANVIADVGAFPRDPHDEAFIHTYAGRGRETGGPPP